MLAGRAIVALASATPTARNRAAYDAEVPCMAAPLSLTNDSTAREREADKDGHQQEQQHAVSRSRDRNPKSSNNLTLFTPQSTTFSQHEREAHQKGQHHQQRDGRQQAQRNGVPDAAPARAICENRGVGDRAYDETDERGREGEHQGGRRLPISSRS